MTWLRTQDNSLVNLDNAKVIEVRNYGSDRHFVIAEMQITTSEDYAIAPAIFTGDKWYCHQFIDFLYAEIAKNTRVISTAEFFAAFESDDV